MGVIYERDKTIFVRFVGFIEKNEEQFGLDKLSLTERDVLQSIIHFQGKNKHVGLQDILKIVLILELHFFVP